MSTLGDFTDPQGTLQLKENFLIDEYYTSKPLNIPDRAFQVNLLSDIFPTNAYGIFSLFFGNVILDVIAQNTYKYARIQEADLKWKHPNRHPKSHGKTQW